jgi:putative endonuclease
MNRTYYVYILASRSRNLYTGVTNNIERRLIEHRDGLVPGFTTRYNIFRLVHFEAFANINEAIAREKEIKGWRRDKKLWLIKRHNPLWQDLAQWQIQLRKQMQMQIERQQQIPHHRSPKAGDRVRDDSVKAKNGERVRDDKRAPRA